MISYSIFKAINTYFTILNYEIRMFYGNIYLHVHMQKVKLCISESNMIAYSISKAINTHSAILNYKIGIFCRNAFLPLHVQKVNSCKIMHK